MLVVVVSRFSHNIMVASTYVKTLNDRTTKQYFVLSVSSYLSLRFQMIAHYSFCITLH